MNLTRSSCSRHEFDKDFLQSMSGWQNYPQDKILQTVAKLAEHASPVHSKSVWTAGSFRETNCSSTVSGCCRNFHSYQANFAGLCKKMNNKSSIVCPHGHMENVKSHRKLLWYFSTHLIKSNCRLKAICMRKEFQCCVKMHQARFSPCTFVL